ncbi:flavin reductase family protein [Labedaea rhizosphaerae]|uniref:Flavin reductase (DIM6/NTAB) family NADH-FMN oxidoreductase RutF n=1 Tax=Labedaea rhizosphaerae TaxID=598644 RepID=A0A4R6SG42_LABRH|nr:flavin reductase family protein [Labedaea rhizosphaerae]TDQ00497.1 flavin reductase (DIM6/NTAB) family NADH-FMN oxidoreductase RutF [Labedaea rhizosphaerae]
MNGYYTGITVVTAVDAQDRPHGLTCNSLVSATLDPPTLLVCLDNRTGTLAAVRESGAFAVNLLAEGGREAAEIFASRAPDRFAAVKWERSPSGLPRLVDDAFAVAECAVTHMHTVGDHVVVFGLVHDIDGEPASPLLYGMRAFTKPSHPPPTDLVATSQVSGRR